MANRNSRDALGTSLISQQFMLIKLLAFLRNHLWGSSIKFTADEFTTEKVESSLCAIFGTKSRAEIMALGKGVHVSHVDAGAAKPTAAPWGREKPGLSWFNHLDNIVPHNKVDCPKRKLDQSSKVPVFRRNILKPGFKTERGMNGASQKGQAKAKGQGKPKAKAKAKKERPSVIAQLNQTPVTPGSSDLLDVEPMDTDELMSEFDIGANAGRMEIARCPIG
ncbi:hypothetical protein PF005_g14359 [Phytophthora fragariae]|uniref:Uncharacterized protein n=1 Tax=Phytophthora fragariae TaxID=53985 RepID=A0A6A3J873_9STRA|nr:hypothetical protein PF011_g18202 [Phytophthora fragariae]KAE9203016.1 hypothetical protein PF005_g14359 [Phytophthora fragariae]KAE9231116.1 hypothetical protein PF002_g12791 [Phytophthora fragariae]